MEKALIAHGVNLIPGDCLHHGAAIDHFSKDGYTVTEYGNGASIPFDLAWNGGNTLHVDGQKNATHYCVEF
jgi:hypothetical protein